MGFIAPWIPSHFSTPPPRCALRCPSSSAVPWPRSVAADPFFSGRSHRRPAAGRPPGGFQKITGWGDGEGDFLRENVES